MKKSVSIETIIEKLNVPEIADQLRQYKIYRTLYFWDIGISRTKKIMDRISDKPLLIILGEDDIYAGQVIGLIQDKTGRLGDILGWSRFYKKPWINVLLLQNVKYKLKWVNSPIKSLINKSHEIASNFFEAMGPVEQEIIEILKENMIHSESSTDQLIEVKIEESKPEIEIVDVKVITAPKELTHEVIEGILLSLGNLLGYETYTPDKSRIYNDTNLGDISTLNEIPSFTYPRILNIVKGVDVIWFRDGYPQYCFEVEHTTNVTEGLLRLYQIRGIPSKFFIISPSSRIKRFDREILKDPFFKIRDRYSFRSYDTLLEFYSIAKKYHAQKNNFLDKLSDR